jgi:hypothetical protein
MEKIERNAIFLTKNRQKCLTIRRFKGEKGFTFCGISAHSRSRMFPESDPVVSATDLFATGLGEAAGSFHAARCQPTSKGFRAHTNEPEAKAHLAGRSLPKCAPRRILMKPKGQRK